MASATQRSVEDIDWNLDWNSQLNIVYVNIDWKSTRHNTQESCARNKRTLQETIASIVAQMRPDILCMSEVGVASSLMTEEQLEAVAEWCVEQWKRTATGRAGAGWRSPEFFGEQAWKAAQDDFSLSVLYAKDAPYMTIYNEKKCICTKNAILHNLYKHNEPRTAQHMLFEPRTGAIGNLELLEIVNVHAPSGKKPLTDSNRKELIFHILQSESLENPATTIGHKNFLIGGDMNTAPGTLTELLTRAYNAQVVKELPDITPHQMDAHVKPGDYCFLQGIRSEPLPRDGAHNHDPKHDPYGITWIPARRKEEHSRSTMASSSTSPYMRKWMPKRPPPTVSLAPAPKRARPAGGQSTPNGPLSATPPCPLKATPPCPPLKATPPVHEEGKAGLPLKAKAPAPKIATPKPSPPAIPTRGGDCLMKLTKGQKSSLKLETIHEVDERSEEPTEARSARIWALLERPDPRPTHDDDARDNDSCQDDDDPRAGAYDDETELAPTARGAELHRRWVPQQNRAQELLYNVLNAMLDHVSFQNDSAEAVLRDAVERQESSMRFKSQSNGDINAIEQIFAPVFYELGFQKKYQAQQRQWQPKPTSATYIKNWRQYSAMRAFWNPTTPITPLQVLEESEWQNVLDGERNEYKKQYQYLGWKVPKPKQWRTAFCVKLRDETGDKRIAFAIWKLGMPETATVPDEITESTQLTSEIQERLATDAARILSWFYKVAVHCIQQDPNEWSVQTSGATHPNPRSQCGPFLTQGGPQNCDTSDRQSNAWQKKLQKTNTWQYESWSHSKYAEWEPETVTASHHQSNAWQKKSQKTNTGQYESWSHSEYAEWRATWQQHYWQGARQQCSWKAGTWSE